MVQKLRVLGVNAHPHDFTWYSGTLGIHAASGDAVTVVSVTPGESAHNQALHDELMKPEAERDPASVMKVSDSEADSPTVQPPAPHVGGEVSAARSPRGSFSVR